MSRKRFSFSLVAALAVLAAQPVVGSSAAAQTVRGTILDAETGRPVALAYVGLLAEDREVVVADLASDGGTFTLRAPEEGEYFLYVRGDGYETVTDGLFELGENGVFDVRVGLKPEPIELETIPVAARRSVGRLEASGFYDRVLTAPGHFLSREDVTRVGGSLITEVLRGVPRVQIDVSRPLIGPDAMRGASVFMRRGTESCSPTLYIDRHVVATGAIEPVRPDEYVSPSEVEAVEIYTSASDVPVDFDPINNCGVILIWTRIR